MLKLIQVAKTVMEPLVNRHFSVISLIFGTYRLRFLFFQFFGYQSWKRNLEREMLRWCIIACILLFFSLNVSFPLYNGSYKRRFKLLRLPKFEKISLHSPPPMHKRTRRNSPKTQIWEVSKIFKRVKSVWCIFLTSWNQSTHDRKVLFRWVPTILTVQQLRNVQ